ncbi:hypothetical protein ACFSSA_07370 [Luteolibacter algae]|uniref:TPM domain-containing protein n=1 Tax=Luteolibacter algae TaxID=454151 RepID=A0ABW5D6V7_9BACT
MKCPRCVQRIHRAAAACPHCGFSLADADRMFGDGEVKLRSLTDAAGIFRRQDRDKLEDFMERFGEAFPQMFVAVYTGSLGETGNLRQFGFWLLNRGVFEDVPVEKPNEAGVLIVIDPDTKTAGMTFGYLLDAFFEEKDTFDCLTRAHSHWLEGRYADGLLRSLKHLDKLLRKRCRQVRKDPEKYERRVVNPVAVEDLVKKIRGEMPNQLPCEEPETEVKK